MHTRIGAFGLFIRNRKNSRNINALTIVKLAHTLPQVYHESLKSLSLANVNKHVSKNTNKIRVMAKDLKIYWWRIKLLKRQ